MTARPLLCSFCAKSQHDVRKLIAGPAVFICDECVTLCNDILDAEPPAKPRFRVRADGWIKPATPRKRWPAIERKNVADPFEKRTGGSQYEERVVSDRPVDRHFVAYRERECRREGYANALRTAARMLDRTASATADEAARDALFEASRGVELMPVPHV